MIKSFCVLIPSYNEGRTIAGIVRSLRARGLIVYVVDDGSLDDTAKLAAREGAMVVHHHVNKGKGASLREGFRHIVKRHEFDAVLVMDGDGQHALSDIDVFVGRINESGAGMVVGNRMTDVSNMPIVRIMTNRFMSTLLTAISGQKIPDTQCGYRLIRRSVLERINLESSNYEIESETIIKVARAGFGIVSVPIQTVYKDEKSHINPFIDTVRFIIFLVRISFSR